MGRDVNTLRVIRARNCGPGCANSQRSSPPWFRLAYHYARGEGWVVNPKKSQRLWREQGCGCRDDGAPQTARPRNRTRAEHRRRAEPRVASRFPVRPTTHGRPINSVSIFDDHTRAGLGGRVERSITGEHLIAELDHDIARASMLGRGALR